MPSHPLSYNVHTPQQSQKGKKWVQRVIKNKPRSGLIGAIISAYVLVAGVIGFAMFSGWQDQSQASEQSAFVSASLRLLEEEEYGVGSRVQTSLTIQNTSIVNPINNLNIEFNSTKNSVKWDSATLTSRTSQLKELEPSGNTFVIPLLAAGERAEYQVSGILTESNFDFLTLVSTLTFENRDGLQNASTNRVFTKLQDTRNNDLLTLETDKTDYAKEDEIKLKLSYRSIISEEDPLAPQVKGKIYLTQENTKNVVSGLDCELGNNAECEVAIEKLEPGTYTALFIDEQEKIFSRIVEFNVAGESGTFRPSNLAVFRLPFNNNSVNGIVPVFAEKVIGLNDNPSGERCTFEVLQGENIVSRVNSKINDNRTCFTTLDSSQLKNGNGTYTIRLAGTSKSSNVIFTQKSPNLIPLQNLTTVMKVGNSVQVSASDIPELVIADEEEETESEESEDAVDFLEQGKATLGIWHPSTGEYKELNSLGGAPVEVVDGQLNVNIPGEEFSKGGFYSVYFELEDGRQTEFLGLGFNDEDIGFSQSGVLVEKLDNLRVGKDITFRLNNITDRSGNKISQAECTANLYLTGSGPVPITEKGEIKDGVCRVTVPADKVTRSGPALISFTGDNVTNKINQSKQIFIAPNSPKDYGFLGMEYEPARTGYANNIIIGPVTDIYGNATNAPDYKVRIFDISPQEKVETEEQSEETLKEDERKNESVLLAEYDANIEDGFAKITAPASLFDTQKVQVILFDQADRVIKEKDVDVFEEQERLILPNFPERLNSDEKINFGLTNLDPELIEECKLIYFRSQEEYSENKVKVNPETRSCEFDWALNQFRNNPFGLIQLQAGDQVYTDTVKHLSGEASSLFVSTPQLRINERDEVEVKLLTSPIVDINGLPVAEGNLRWEFNGNTEENRIENGFANLILLADKIGSPDLRTVLDQKFLELSLDARASVTSVNKTNSLSIYLGTKDISNTQEEFSIISATSKLPSGQKTIFEFQTEACKASILSDRTIQTNIMTHWQGGKCYVEVNGNLGDHRILFEENGFTLGQFDYRVADDRTEVIWCETNSCEIQVVSQNRGSIEAIVYDEEKQYKFEADSVENIIKIEQNGLNPLKEYLVEIRFFESGGEIISAFKQLPGEYIQLQNSANDKED